MARDSERSGCGRRVGDRTHRVLAGAPEEGEVLGFLNL